MLAGIVLAACAGAGIGVLAGSWFTPDYEHVAFVRAGSIEREQVIPRPDLLDRINGLSTASDVGARLGRSPWLVWRRYVVTTEGDVYVARVQSADPVDGQRIVDAVRDSLIAVLRGRYDAAMIPHRAYMSSLEREAARLTEEIERVANAGRSSEGTAGRGTADRWVALAEIRQRLRDAQVFAALSEEPAQVGMTRRLDPDWRSYRRRTAATGAVIGFITAGAFFIVAAARARSAPTGA